MIYLMKGDIMELVNGKNIQKNFLNKLKKEMKLFKDFKEIAIISTGENLLGDAYFKAIQRMAKEMNIPLRKIHFDYISEKNY